jgi:hypothetical protein
MGLSQVRLLNRHSGIFKNMLFGKKFKQIITLLNDIRTAIFANGITSLPGLGIGTTKPNVANVAFTYIIAGIEYTKAAVAAGTALSGDNVPVDLYGAWALDIDAAGTITIAPAADNATGYASAALAAAGLPAVASTKVRMGYVTVISDTGVFDPGTTDLDAAAATDVYTDASTPKSALSATAVDDINGSVND